MNRRRARLPLVAGRTVALGLSLVVASCGAGLGRPGGDEARQIPPWVRAVFPITETAPVRIDRYEGVVALVRGGQVYGATSAEDLPGPVVGMASALALVAEGPTLRRVGQVGFGTGLSVGVALGVGARAVDVFEADGHVVAAAEALAEQTRLSFQNQDGAIRPIHPALRLVPPSQAATERFLRYDVIFSPPETSTIVGPERLLTVERLQNILALLSSDGVLVHHLPAYDLQPESFRRMLRTFVEVFSFVIVVSAAPGSADLFLIGAATPLHFRVDQLRALASSAGLEGLLPLGRLHHPFDLPARVLFASRQEVLAFAQNAQPCTASAPIVASELSPRPPTPPPDAPAAERSAWQEALTAHRQRFQRMDLLREQMYGLDWPNGQVCPEGPGSPSCLLAGLEAGEGGAEVLAELSLSLMAAGRFVEAQTTLESAGQLARGPLTRAAQQALVLLLDDPPDLLAQLPEALAPVQEALTAARCVDAARGAREVVRPSPEQRLVAAYALVRCEGEATEAMTTVVSLIEPVVGDEAFVQRYPMALYLLARARMVGGAYDDATWIMVDYVTRLELPRPSGEGRPASPPPPTPS